MKGIIICSACAVVLFSSATGSLAKESGMESGKTLFEKNCSACHPEGKNIINPKKTLFEKDRKQNNINTAKDIIRLMRNPGPGMQQFDKSALPDKEAEEIAEYVLKTFR